MRIFVLGMVLALMFAGASKPSTFAYEFNCFALATVPNGESQRHSLDNK